MSRIIDILTAIRNGENYTGEPLSRVEAILKSIANKTPYTATAQSRHEQLLLAIKNGQTVSGTARTRVEEILFAIANGTLDAYLSGKNLFDEAIWRKRTVVENKTCLEFSGFYQKGTGEKMGTPLLIAENLPQGTYTVRGKFKKTTLFNALAVMNIQNERTEIGQFADNFEQSSITFTTTDFVKRLYLDTGGSAAKGYCEIESLKLEIGSTATPYTSYAFLSELESAYVSAANKLKGA
jgi:hypothetical protein